MQLFVLVGVLGAAFSDLCSSRCLARLGYSLRLRYRLQGRGGPCFVFLRAFLHLTLPAYAVDASYTSAVALIPDLRPCSAALLCLTALEGSAATVKTPLR